jgi:organic radical activating enzyme
MTVDEIVAECKASHVVLTGGEPTLYALTELINALRRKKGRRVAIETNGTRNMNPNWKLNWVTCSPKPPDYKVACACNELKYVVTEDFNPDVITWKGASKGKIWLQPESHKPESMQKAYKLAMAYPEYLRVGIQLHKVFEVR